MKKHFFAAVNEYATESSRGFANTWAVMVFNSKAARDAYVEKATDLATCTITKKEIGKYIDRPKPFSGEHWAIMDWSYWEEDKGYKLGYVECIGELDALNNPAYKGRVHSER